jgi:N6-L-threonylcarbamoyladenine synthase
MLVLGIESSCDETAAAVVADGRKVLSDVVFSQVDVHKAFGGVVPELASRKHIEAISVVIARAIAESGIKPSEIQGIGVTRGPGLIGSLLVGISAAKGMALALNLPIAGVNHLHGHLSAASLERDDLRFPFMALVVSGGHTSLYHVKSWSSIEIVGRTRDDAAGEAFDKVAKLLGFGYPGGVVIERRADGVDPNGLRFPRALMEPGNLDFSFSGLKTAVLRQVEEVTGVSRNQRRPGSFHPLISDDSRSEHEQAIKTIAAAFQEAVVDVLAAKAVAAAKAFACSQLVVCGGVAANKSLRGATINLAAKNHIEAIFPSVSLCTDNAAMIAARADFLLSVGQVDDLNFNAKSRW